MGKIGDFSARCKKYGAGKTMRWYGSNLSYPVLESIRKRQEARRDQRICGRALSHHGVSLLAERRGATESSLAPYATLELMFEGQEFDADTMFLDVGCGEGRVLAFLLEQGFPGTIHGIELDSKIAAQAKAWTQGRGNLLVMEGDALDLDLSCYDALFMWRPMVPSVFQLFIRKLEMEAGGKVRLFYLSDQQSGDYLLSRAGWTLEKQEWVHWLKGLPQHPNPQRWSIWAFDPAHCK